MLSFQVRMINDVRVRAALLHPVPGQFHHASMFWQFVFSRWRDKIYVSVGKQEQNEDLEQCHTMDG